MLNSAMKAVVAVSCALVLVVGAAAQAAPVNVLLGQTPIAEVGWQNFGSGGTGALTNGAWYDTGPYSSLTDGASVTYYLGSVTAVTTLGFQENVAGRAVPKFVTLTFSDTADFAVSTDRVVSLVHVHDPQWSAFDMAAGQYLRVTMPAGQSNYDIDADDQWTATAEIQALTPEPTTLVLLALGGLPLIRRRK